MFDIFFEEVRERGLEFGKEIGKIFGEYEIVYVEYLYVRVKYRDVKVDLVFCYDVRDWKDVRIVVDCLIFYIKWVNENFNGKNNEVRLFKCFFKGIKVYGSEIYV